MLMAFVEEMGHDYEDLLESAIDETAEDNGIDSTTLVASGRAIHGTLGHREEDEEDEEEGEEGMGKRES